MTPTGFEPWGGLVVCQNDTHDEVDGFCALAGGVAAARATCAFFYASPENDIPQEGYYCTCWDFLHGEGCETNDQPWRFMPILWEICLTLVPCLWVFIFSVRKLTKYKRKPKEPAPIALHCMGLVAFGSLFMLVYTSIQILWLGANIYEPWQDLLIALCVPLWEFPLATGLVLQIFVFEKFMADVPTKVKQRWRLGRKGIVGLIVISFVCLFGLVFPLLTHNFKVVSLVTLFYSAFIAFFYVRAAFRFKEMLQELAVLHRETAVASQVGRDTFAERLHMALSFIRRTSVLSGVGVFLVTLENMLVIDTMPNVQPAVLAIHWVRQAALMSAFAGLLCLLAWFSASALDRLQKRFESKFHENNTNHSTLQNTAESISGPVMKALRQITRTNNRVTPTSLLLPWNKTGLTK